MGLKLLLGLDKNSLLHINSALKCLLRKAVILRAQSTAMTYFSHTHTDANELRIARNIILYQWLISPFIKQSVPFTGIVFGKLQGRGDLRDLDADGMIVIITCINNEWGE